MRAYIVRHAESTSNARRVHQTPAATLSAVGRRQARLLAQRLHAVPVDLILSSPYERARRTAAALACRQSCPLTLTPLLVEIKRPTEIEGRHYDDPAALAITSAIRGHSDDETWRYSDEEPFVAARERARRCLAYLHSLTARTVIVVTHGRFMTMLLGVIVYGADVRPRDFAALRRHLAVSNTGITICDDAPETGWTVVTWNEQTHLHPEAST